MNNTTTRPRGPDRESEAAEDAFRAYVELRRGHLLRTATMLTAGDRWMAEDLVQTALARLYVAWGRVRADTVDAYARRCLLNALIDHRRLVSTRRESVREQPPEQTAVPGVEPELRAVVYAALAQLPPKMRAAVVMRHLLDLSVEETADALRCRRGTVKSQTARGLSQLREALSRQGVSVSDMSETTPARRRSPRGMSPAGDLTTNS